MKGRRRGSYRIIARLGAGGIGEVYRAHDDKLQRDVAIKVLPAAGADDPLAAARLLREARDAGSTRRSPNTNGPEISTH